jgi:hypothetical protein
MSDSCLEGVSILVANDDYALAQEACTWLRALGAEICGPVASEDEAVRMIDAGRRIDGALLKLDLRDGSTAALARALDRNGIPFACLGAATPPQRGRPVLRGSPTAYAAVSALLRTIEARQPFPSA